jgi:RNA polymerase sigma factor (sigma-70 family)
MSGDHGTESGSMGSGSGGPRPVARASIEPDPAPKEASEESFQLVGAIQRGDRDAERAFALRYMRPVKAMLLARSRNPDVASDLQQDVMIEAICALRRGQLRDAEKLSGFVMAIARNVLNNHFRGEARRPEALEVPDDLPDLSSIRGDAEEHQRETLAMDAIGRLESLDRTILQMTLVDGLKPGIIAERLSMNPEVVRQRKLRATRRVVDFVRTRSQNDSPRHLVMDRRT